MPTASAAATAAIIETRIRILPPVSKQPGFASNTDATPGFISDARCSVEFPAMQAFIRFVATAALAGLFSSLYAQTAGQGAWTSKAPLGTVRTETGAAFAGGKLYVVAGGLAMAESSALVQEYDPRTDRW